MTSLRYKFNILFKKKSAANLQISELSITFALRNNLKYTVIRLARHIETLLLSNECVMVPDLGGFLAHRLTARYDADEELFLPPLRTLGFNPHLKINDSLLVTSYSDAYDLTYTEAVDAIANEVAELKDILENSGSYELNNLGRLYYDNERKLNFEPCEAGILTPGFYALSSFSMSPITNNADDENDATSHKPKVIYIGSEDGRKTLNISLKAVRNISAAAVVIATAILVALPISRNGMALSGGNIESGFYEMFNPSHNNASKQTTSLAMVKPKAKMAVEMKTEPQVNVQKADNEKVAEPETQNYWSIVLCAGVPQGNAEKLAEKVKADGYDDAFVYKDDNVKVLYGKYTSKEEALNNLREMRSDKYFKDGWLLEVKAK